MREYGGKTTTCTQSARTLCCPPPGFKGGAWRDRGSVVVTRGGRLPPRCVRCNEPGEGKSIWMRFKWTPRIFTGVAEASQLARFALGEEVTLKVYLCPIHKRRYLGASRAGWLMPLIGVSAVIAGGVSAKVLESAAVLEILSIGGVLVCVIGLVWGSIAKGRLRVAAVESRFAWIAGCHPDFVKSLPGLAEASTAANAEAGARLEQIGETSEPEE